MTRDGALWSERELHDLLCAFKDSRFAQIIGHWLALRQNDQVPLRSAIDPCQFRQSLDMVWLMERHGDGHYRYRLAGQNIVRMHGGGIRRGTGVSELFGKESLAMFQPRWEAVLDRGLLVRAEGSVTLGGGAKTSRLERLMLPLRTDDNSVSVVLGATHYQDAVEADGVATSFPPTDIECCPATAIPLGASL